MMFNLNIPAPDGTSLRPELQPGELLFVLGVNGTGKSSLMLHFNKINGGKSQRISAHRQTWLTTDTLDLTPAKKRQTERNIQNTDHQKQTRYRDRYAEERSRMTIFKLINAENVRARGIAKLVDVRDWGGAEKASKEKAPIAVINELLKHSNIPIEISIQENERIMARKNGGPEYSAAELSDGERNALLIAGDVLTAEPGTLLIIDEPERHLHRSIISPLLGQLFQRRSDCAFVVSTHDHNLPLKLPDARTLLVRSCTFKGSDAQTWEVDELPSDVSLDDTLRRDLLGARRKILFVEGTEGSLDKAIYSLIFPMVSVIPKGNCNDVERAVAGLRAGEDIHWLQAFGIVDGDGYAATQIEEKKNRGVYALAVYSVEAIYFHPEIIQLVAKRKADLLGKDETTLFKNAIEAGIAAIKEHTERLSQNVAKKSARKLIVEQIPNDDILLGGKPVNLQNEAVSILQDRKAELDAAVANNDWETILTKCSVKDSSAQDDISRALRFRDIPDYQKAVLQLLATDDSALEIVRRLFSDLFEKLQD